MPRLPEASDILPFADDKNIIAFILNSSEFYSDLLSYHVLLKLNSKLKLDTDETVFDKLQS